MPVDPASTRILRIIPIDNLEVYLKRKGAYAPHHEPKDGLDLVKIHDVGIQETSDTHPIPCGPCGTIHDYLAFYFGFLSPMLLRVKTGWNVDWTRGQEPILYLVSTIEQVLHAGLRFVFSDGQRISFQTNWYDDVTDLDKVDWGMVNERYWRADYDAGPEGMDRQRRKQAEFLVHEFFPWELVIGIGVINADYKRRVEAILKRYPQMHQPPVKVKRDWYYR